MNISQFMRDDLVFLDVNARDKLDVFRVIVQGMAQNRIIEHPQSFLEEIIQREVQAPTCIGRGIALPHTRTIFVDRPIIAFARTAEPISFGKQPGDNVSLFFLMGTPKSDPNIYLRILGNLCRLLRQKEIRHTLTHTHSPNEVVEIFSEKKEPENV